MKLYLPTEMGNSPKLGWKLLFDMELYSCPTIAVVMIRQFKERESLTKRKKGYTQCLISLGCYSTWCNDTVLYSL